MQIVSPEFSTLSISGAFSSTTSPNIAYSLLTKIVAPPAPPPSVGGAGAGMLVLGKFRIKSRRKRKR